MGERLRPVIDFLKALYGRVLKWAKSAWTEKAKPRLITTRSRVVAWWNKKAFPFIKSRPSRFLDIFSKKIWGVRLLKKWTSLTGYFALLLGLLTVIVALDQHPFTRQFIHISNSNEAVIGVFTVLLTLLVPIAIALIEDARESVLARQTIVKRVIRLQWAPFVLVLACIFLFIPAGIEAGGNSLTWRNLYGAVLICCTVFLLTILYRSYRWLSDGSEYSEGDIDDGGNDTPPDFDLQSAADSSYKFSVLADSAKGYQAWTRVWSRRYPVGYEDVLHQSFFYQQFAILDHKKSKKYGILSLALEAYDKFYNRRNVHSVQFEFVYPKQFLDMHGKISKILETDRVEARLAGLYRGENAIKNTIAKVIDNMMDNNRVWHMFKAMQDYATDNDLIDIGDRDRLNNDSEIRLFLEKFFDAVVSDTVDTYQIDSYFEKKSPWAVTYDNLYVTRRNLSFLVVETFKDWLFQRLDSNKKDDNERIFVVDSIVSTIFPEVDPMTFGTLYWMLYKCQHTVESDTIVELNYKEGRPIGLMGRVMTGTWPGDDESDHKEALSKAYAEFNNQQEQNAIKLFATLYAPYLRRFWNLAEIQKAISKVDRKKLDEHETVRLESFERLIGKIQEFYKKIDADMKNKARSKKN